jgi:hypothetical protein
LVAASGAADRRTSLFDINSRLAAFHDVPTGARETLGSQQRHEPRLGHLALISIIDRLIGLVPTRKKPW